MITRNTYFKLLKNLFVSTIWRFLPWRTVEMSFLFYVCSITSFFFCFCFNVGRGFNKEVFQCLNYWKVYFWEFRRTLMFLSGLKCKHSLANISLPCRVCCDSCEWHCLLSSSELAEPIWSVLVSFDATWSLLSHYVKF